MRTSGLLNRRQLILCAVAAAGGAAAQSLPAVRHPRRDTLQAGDLLWTAEPGAFIPYSSASVGQQEQAAHWVAARKTAVAALRSSGRPDDKAAADTLESLSFDAFRAGYVEDRKVEDMKLYAGAGFAVGHVGVVDVEDARLYVVEARPDASTTASAAFSRFKNGVVRTPYADWIEGNANTLVWHGRLKSPVAPRALAKIGAEARRHLGRDYWFWSLDLADTTSFYCSKLVWRAAFDALQMPIDGDKGTSRKFWLSPKRLMRHDANIAMLFSPAPYG